MNRFYRRMLISTLAALTVYCATVFPFIALTGVDDVAWGLVFFVYGVGLGTLSNTIVYRRMR